MSMYGEFNELHVVRCGWYVRYMVGEEGLKISLEKSLILGSTMLKMAGEII